MNRLRLLALLQGIYYAATGLWPLLHMPSFLAITGPKQDLWLVNTVGVLVLVIAVVLLFAAARRVVAPEVRLLGAGSAAGLATIEFYYGLAGQVWPVYLLDGVLELILVLLWAVLWFRGYGKSISST